MKKLWIVLVVATMALAGFGYAARDQISGLTTSAEAATTTTETAAAEAAPILAPVRAGNQVIVEARVAPVREAQLSMTGSGLVAEVLAVEGDLVAAGAPIVRLHGQRQAASLAQAQANLRNAELQLAQLTVGPRQEEITRYQASIALAQANLQKVLDGANRADVVSARTNLLSAEAALRQAQAEYDKVGWRTDIGMLPQAASLEQANNSYVAAQAQLDELLAGPRSADIARAQAEVRVAQADLEIILAGSSVESIAAAEAQVAAAQAVVQDAQAALDELVLRTPFAGILAAVNVEVGEQVSPGAIVAHLADLSAWRIETADLTELSVVNVQAGDRVEIAVDALPDSTLTGRVMRIKPIGENVQGDITYTGLITLDAQDARLRWNMTAQTTIIQDEAGRTAALASKADVAVESLSTSVQAGEPVVAAPAEDALTQVAEILAATASAVETENVAPVAAQIQGTVQTSGANLNARSGPGVESPVVGQVASGTVVTVLGRNQDGSWLQIQVEGEDASWVAGQFVVLTTQIEIAQLPVAVNLG